MAKFCDWPSPKSRVVGVRGAVSLPRDVEFGAPGVREVPERREDPPLPLPGPGIFASRKFAALDSVACGHCRSRRSESGGFQSGSMDTEPASSSSSCDNDGECGGVCPTCQWAAVSFDTGPQSLSSHTEIGLFRTSRNSNGLCGTVRSESPMNVHYAQNAHVRASELHRLQVRGL